MKKHITYCFAVAITLASALSAVPELRGTPPSLHPGDGKSLKEVTPVEEACLFRDSEIQADFFGLGDFYQGNNNGNIWGLGPQPAFSGRPAWGGGVGLNYIFARYFGVGIEQDVFGRKSEATANDANFGYTRWATLGQIIVRYPVCAWNLAPYIVVGGGAIYGNVGAGNIFASPTGQRYKLAGQGVGLIGGGLEYRITAHIGIFSDARYLFSNVANLPNNQLMWRYGMRLAF